MVGDVDVKIVDDGVPAIAQAQIAGTKRVG
jgi:hypothetical protein